MGVIKMSTGTNYTFYTGGKTGEGGKTIVRHRAPSKAVAVRKRGAPLEHFWTTFQIRQPLNGDCNLKYITRFSIRWAGAIHRLARGGPVEALVVESKLRSAP